jgi:hypothetical protein
MWNVLVEGSTKQSRFVLMLKYFWKARPTTSSPN